jgi:hypothetical protein
LKAHNVIKDEIHSHIKDEEEEKERFIFLFILFILRLLLLLRGSRDFSFNRTFLRFMEQLHCTFSLFSPKVLLSQQLQRSSLFFDVVSISSAQFSLSISRFETREQSTTCSFSVQVTIFTNLCMYAFILWFGCFI